MNEETAITIYTDQAPGTYVDTSTYDVLASLTQIIDDWLKTSKSDSEKTRKAREETFKDFCTGLDGEGLRLDSPPTAIAHFVATWAATSKREGVTVAPSTYNQHIALVSSFYSYAIAHEVLKGLIRSRRNWYSVRRSRQRIWPTL